MKEELLMLPGSSTRSGIVCRPNSGHQDQRETCIILLNAGRIHRVGGNRLNVRLARLLAATGFRSFRFDYSWNDKPLSDFDPNPRLALLETSQAIESVVQSVGCSSFVLFGFCSGGGVAFHMIYLDSRVNGAIIVNSTDLYLPNPLSECEVALSGCFSEMPADRSKLKQILFVSSEKSPNRDFAKTVIGDRQFRQDPTIISSEQVIIGADHNLTLLRHQQELDERVIEWVRQYP